MTGNDKTRSLPVVVAPQLGSVGGPDGRTVHGVKQKPAGCKKQNTLMGTAASDTMTEPAQQGTIRHMRGAVIDARRNDARRNVPNSVLPIRDDNATTLVGTIESQRPNE